MREACTSLNANFKPKITFLVAQKRHKTRLFPADPAKDGVGRMKNVPPGTIADEVIVHPTEESFYLASHEGIQVRKQRLQRLKKRPLVKWDVLFVCLGNNKTHPLS